jgi:glycosyltransferase involved in cell wall biosynthesis
VALRHVEALQERFDVSLVSDGFPSADGFPGRGCEARVPDLRRLRRLAHVPNEILFALSALGSLMRLHRTHPVDAILCHGHVLAAVTGRMFRRSSGVPFVLVTHGDVFDRPKGTYGGALTALYRALTPAAYGEADAVIALSPCMSQLAIRGGATRGSVQVIPNGIAPEDIGLGAQMPARSPDADGMLRLLYVGRLALEKGVGDLLEACRHLRGRRFAFRLRVIGDGPLREELSRRAAEGGLNGAVTFCGSLQRRSLGAEYRAADVVCVPSVNDPLPGVVLEALAAGTPVIGTRVGGIPFMIEHGENGLLVEPSDPGALAAAIEAIAAPDGARQRMGRRAASSVLTRFSWETTGRRLAELMDRIGS